MTMKISHKRTQGKQGGEQQNLSPASLFSMRSFVAKSSASRGFTLMEMMITLAVFILLVAAVFALMTGVLESTGSLQDNQNRKDTTAALNAYLKKKLTEMPVNTTLASYQRGDGEGLVQNGIIFGTINFATAIDATTQPNGLYTLRMANLSTAAESQQQDARQVLTQSVTTNDPTLVWTALMQDIKTLDWKFLDFNQTVWVELWNSGSNPNLVEFDMQPGGDQQPTTMDFWLPKITPVQLSAAAQAATSAATGTTTTPSNTAGRSTIPGPRAQTTQP